MLLNKLAIILFLFIFCSQILLAVSGKVFCKTSGKPLEFVNIGIAGKNIGTVSDINGDFTIKLDTFFKNDTLMFSCIGFEACLVAVSDLAEDVFHHIYLTEKTYELKEVNVRFRKFREKILGVTAKNKSVAAGFSNNLLGYECGILMRNKKSALIKQIKINISHCTYDTIFYRLNIYQPKGKNNFENILEQPIYLNLPKASVKETILLDITSKRIFVEGNFLVTLEHVKNLGDGGLYFCAGLSHKTYFRKTSQGNWNTVPVGVSIYVIADVEK